MEHIEVSVDTSERQIVDLTELARWFCTDTVAREGLLNVFAPHSTVGLALVHVDDGSGADLLAALDRLLPRDVDYAHRERSPGHGADHLVPALLSPSLVIPVVAGAPAIGEFQRLVLVDLDRDATMRTVRLTLLIEERGDA
jgi:secondary thiamine-phosphate synthase enzyme